MDVNKIAEEMSRVAVQRCLNDRTKKIDIVSLLKHLSTEVVECAMAYQAWISDDCPEQDFTSELGDVLAIVFIICGTNSIDVEKIINDTYDKNLKRSLKKGDKL